VTSLRTPASPRPPAPTDALDRFSYRVGRLSKAHGLGGELALQLFRPRRVAASRLGLRRAPEPELVALALSEAGVEPHLLTHVRFLSPSKAVIRLASVDDRDAAERLEGAFLDLDPDRLPALLTDEADALFGAEAYEVGSGRSLGRVRELRDNGAQPLLVLGEDEARELMIPFVEAFVTAVEKGEGGTRVGIRPIPGLLDPAESEVAQPEPGAARPTARKRPRPGGAG
jgi:16S rRNA processing protein RimM